MLPKTLSVKVPKQLHLIFFISLFLTTTTKKIVKRTYNPNTPNISSFELNRHKAIAISIEGTKIETTELILFGNNWNTVFLKDFIDTNLEMELTNKILISIALINNSKNNPPLYKRYNRGSVRIMRIYNVKQIFLTITPFLTTLRKF
nr:hypothetical protein [Bacillus sp. CH30_1T]